MVITNCTLSKLRIHVPKLFYRTMFKIKLKILVEGAIHKLFQINC